MDCRLVCAGSLDGAQSGAEGDGRAESDGRVGWLSHVVDEAGCLAVVGSMSYAAATMKRLIDNVSVLASPTT